jgi:hypothetical protein
MRLMNELQAAFDIADSGETAVFVLRMPEGTTTKDMDRTSMVWQHLWQKAGRDAPPLLILEDAMSLETLTPGALKAAGLMRIPDDAP